MVVSAGTRQLAAHRSQACRRACPAGTTNERRPAGRAGGVHLRPRLGPANSLSAVCVRGRRAVVKDIGVRLPNDVMTGRRPRMTRALSAPTTARRRYERTPAAVQTRT